MIRPVIHRALQKMARVPVARALTYGAQAVRYRLHYGDALRWHRLAADYPQWRESRIRGGRPLADGRAWITYGAIDFLQARLSRTMRVFEYGAGGSTIFLASRVGHVVSVEHDENWAREVAGAAAALSLTNATILHVAPSPAAEPIAGMAHDPEAYVSSNPEWAGQSFRAYASAIDNYVDAGFHVVLLDGRARPSCFKHALPKVAPGGILMLDNAERGRYAYIRNTLDALGWRRYDFAGAGPYNLHFWKTSAWERPVR